MVVLLILNNSSLLDQEIAIRIEMNTLSEFRDQLLAIVKCVGYNEDDDVDIQISRK